MMGDKEGQRKMRRRKQEKEEKGRNGRTECVPRFWTDFWTIRRRTEIANSFSMLGSNVVAVLGERANKL